MGAQSVDKEGYRNTVVDATGPLVLLRILRQPWALLQQYGACGDHSGQGKCHSLPEAKKG